MDNNILNGILNCLNWSIAIVIIKIYFGIFFAPKEQSKTGYIFGGYICFGKLYLRIL